MITVNTIMRREKHYPYVVQKLRSKLSPFRFGTTPEEISTVRSYIMAQSCSELPPSLGAVHGLGTEPLLLYRSIPVDCLHVLDLGVIRAFTDLTVQNFTKKKLSTLPTSQCIAISNNTLRSLSRGLHLPKVSIFLHTPKQLLSGMAGLIRLQVCPFLWICVMGLNKKFQSDEDPLLQTALELDHIHGKLLGANMDLSLKHRSQQ